MTVTETIDPSEGSRAAYVDDLNVVFLIDITGSMSAQIAGVKQMVSSFCQTERPGIRLHIWTFTEDAKHCYVTSSPDLSARALVSYAEKLNLCRPPDMSVSASGGDGPENVVAGVSLLKERFPKNKENVLCFIITDNSPHHKSFGMSAEATTERQWLAAKGYVDTDIFKVLNQVIEDVNVTFVPIIYGREACNDVWYHQAVLMTGGLLLSPAQASAATLAKGLEAILRLLQTTTLANRVDPAEVGEVAQKLQNSFSFIPLDNGNFQPRDSEPDNRQQIYNASHGGASSNGLEAAMIGLVSTTCDRFSGKKAGKRIRTIHPSVVINSIRVFVMSMLQAAGRDDLVDSKALETCHAALLKALEIPFGVDFDAAQVEFLKNMVGKMLEMNKKPVAESTKGLAELRSVSADHDDEEEEDDNEEPSAFGHPVQCLVTLESAVSVLKELEEPPSSGASEDDLKPWMELAMSLCMVRLVDLNFPKDPITGGPDFADAWSSRVRNVSLASVLSAAAAATLRSSEGGDGETFRDPLTNRKHSSALILAHPNDPILSCAYRSLTYLPGLHGIIQSYLVSGGLRIFPSLAPGIQAASLVQLLDPGRKSVRWDAESKQLRLPAALWEVVRCLLHSLKIAGPTPAKKVVKAIREGEGLNPADAIPKLLAGIIGFLNRRSPDEPVDVEVFKNLSRQLAEEITGAAVATFESYVKQSEASGAPVSYARFITPAALASALVGDDKLDAVPEDFDPLQRLHPIEEFLDAFVPSTSRAKTVERLPIPSARSQIASIVEKVKKTNVFERSAATVRVLQRVLVADVKEADADKALAAALEHPFVQAEVTDDGLAHIMAASVILGSRSGRYETVAAPEGKPTGPPQWRRLRFDETPFANSARKIVKDAFKDQLKAWSELRATVARSRVIQMAVALVKDQPSVLESAEAAEEGLKTCRVEYVGRVTVLQRMDVVAVLERLSPEALATVGVALVLGTNWTTEPPSQLRRRAAQILDIISLHIPPETSNKISIAMKAREVCQRETPNRHGHTRENPYPGRYGWTEDYAKKRRAVGSHFAKRLALMKQFTMFRVRVLEMDLAMEQKVECERMFSKYEDSTYDVLVAAIQKVVPSAVPDL
ncbi:hypothetical protein HDU96_005270 [Phlyctochytrium bullatum]|nr:hypothetical protein HDU96_005270 [Phlyctochytrium bullatum]